jgi:hypothetical protein
MNYRMQNALGAEVIPQTFARAPQACSEVSLLIKITSRKVPQVACVDTSDPMVACIRGCFVVLMHEALGIF